MQYKYLSLPLTGLDGIDTIVAPIGQTGDVTINARSFTVNFTPDDVVISVTNKFVTEKSNIQCMVTTLDDNMRSISVDRGIGGFLIIANNAPAVAVRVDCLVIG